MDRPARGAAGATVEDGNALIAYGTRALQVDGDLRAGRGWFEAAYRQGERTADAEVMAEAVLGLAGVWLDEHRTAATSNLLRTRLRRVLALLDPAGTLALRVRIRLAGEADYQAGEHGAILAALDEARKCPDPVVRAEALRLAHQCVLGPGHAGLRRALADELIGEAALGASRGELLVGLLYQVVDLFLAGDPHAQRRLGELRTELAQGGHLAVGCATQSIDVMLAIRAGRLDDAERLAGDCFERGHKAGDADADARYAAHLVTIRWYQGRIGELQPMLAKLVDAPELSTVDNSFLAAYAVAAATRGDLHTASAAMATLRGRTLRDLPRSGTWLATMFGLVEAADLLHNRHAAARAHELLSPYADLPVMAGLAATCFGSVHHALGVASLTMGDPTRAVVHLREAVHRNLALGHWPAIVHSRLRLAEALDRVGGPANAAAAREQRDRAEEVAATRRSGTPVTGGTAPGGRPVTASCVRHGRWWRVALGTRSVTVEGTVGMLHLAVLIANPGAEITALDLVAGVDALGRTARGSTMPGQPVLDRAAAERYRQRLAELRDAIEDPASHRDPTRGARVRAERDWLLAELAGNTRAGGRSRTFTDNTERARLAVGKAIRRAVANIERADPLIGAHLRATVHTGVRCWYRPI